MLLCGGGGGGEVNTELMKSDEEKNADKALKEMQNKISKEAQRVST